jgi:hypothetical protein
MPPTGNLTCGPIFTGATSVRKKSKLLMHMAVKIEDNLCSAEMRQSQLV